MVSLYTHFFTVNEDLDREEISKFFDTSWHFCLFSLVFEDFYNTFSMLNAIFS